ncbi:MAG: hypothetical protein AB7T14_02070 [Candidatus Methylacidiphilaceae bacterium]
MRCFGFTILLLTLACSQELLAGVFQTSKGTRLSILGSDPPDASKKGVARPSVAERSRKDKVKTLPVAKAGAPTGRVKVRSVAGSKVKKRDRSHADPNPVASRK